jgi:tetratricopeptide (TPR) repeat protein
MSMIRTVAAANQALEAGLRAEHKDELHRALDHYADASLAAGGDARIVAQALTRQAAVYRRLSEWELAADHARRAHQLAEDADMPDVRADALAAEGNALMCAGRFDEAMAVYQRLQRVAMDDRQRGIAMQNIGSILAQRGAPERAREAFEASRFLFQQAGYMRGEAIASNNLGRLALDCGELPAAEALLQRALIGARAVEDAELAALALLNLAQLRVAQGTLHSAAMMVAGAHAHFTQSENRWRQVECLCVLADVAEGEQRMAEARDHLRRGAELARAIDARVELARIEQRLAALAV